MMTQQKTWRRRRRVKKNRMKLIDIIGVIGWVALIYAAVVLWLI